MCLPMCMSIMWFPVCLPQCLNALLRANVGPMVVVPSVTPDPPPPRPISVPSQPCLCLQALDELSLSPPFPVPDAVDAACAADQRSGNGAPPDPDQCPPQVPAAARHSAAPLSEDARHCPAFGLSGAQDVGHDRSLDSPLLQASRSHLDGAEGPGGALRPSLDPSARPEADGDDRTGRWDGGHAGGRGPPPPSGLVRDADAIPPAPSPPAGPGGPQDHGPSPTTADPLTMSGPLILGSEPDVATEEFGEGAAAAAPGSAPEVAGAGEAGAADVAMAPAAGAAATDLHWGPAPELHASGTAERPEPEGPPGARRTCAPAPVAAALPRLEDAIAALLGPDCGLAQLSLADLTRVQAAVARLSVRVADAVQEKCVPCAVGESGGR